jgi:phage gpG-like protein
MSDIKLETKGLDQLLKALKAKPPVARVGILGEKTNRIEGKKTLTFAEVQSLSTPRKGGNVPTNAEIGASHEFGTSQLPQRSFLRVPLTDRLQKEMEASGALDKAVLAEVIRSGSVVPWLKKVAVLAEGIVIQAFATGGYGKWKPSDMRHKKVHMTLVETQQLRNSITSEVRG